MVKITAVLQEIYDNGGVDGAPANNTVTGALGPPRLKFKTAGDPTIDNVNPIPKPNSGLRYSFWKQVYLKCSVAPSFQCDNFKWFTDGTGFGAGIAFKIGTETPAKTGYEVATGVVGETGDEMVAAHAGLNGSADCFGFISASPKSVSCSEPGGIIDDIGETTDYIILQVEVGPTASAGVPSNEPLTWRWDEV